MKEFFKQAFTFISNAHLVLGFVISTVKFFELISSFFNN